MPSEAEGMPSEAEGMPSEAEGMRSEAEGMPSEAEGRTRTRGPNGPRPRLPWQKDEGPYPPARGGMASRTASLIRRSPALSPSFRSGRPSPWKSLPAVR